MGYYADLIKQKQEKRNEKYSYKLVDKGYSGVLKDEGYHKWVVQTWYGSKLVDEQEVTGPKSKAEAQGQKNVSYFERRNPENSKEETENANPNFYSLIAEGKRRIEEKYKEAIDLAKNKYSKTKNKPGAENIFSEEVKKANADREKELEKFWKEVSVEHR